MSVRLLGWGSVVTRRFSYYFSVTIRKCELCTSANIGTEVLTGRLGFDSWLGHRFLLVVTNSIQALGPTHILIEWVLRA